MTTPCRPHPLDRTERARSVLRRTSAHAGPVLLAVLVVLALGPGGTPVPVAEDDAGSRAAPVDPPAGRETLPTSTTAGDPAGATGGGGR